MSEGVEVRFEFLCSQTRVGEYVAVVGSWTNWTVCDGVTLDGLAYPFWRCTYQLPVGTHEFKLVLVRQDASIEWEQRDNRVIKIDSPCKVAGVFGDGMWQRVLSSCWPSNEQFGDASKTQKCLS